MNDAKKPYASEVNTSRRRNRWFRRLVVVVAIWLAGDFAYSRYVAYRIARWEKEVPWVEPGIAPGAAEVSVGDGSTALLMIHGFSDSPQLYRKMAPALAERGFHCRTILLPGFGSDVEAYAACEIPRWHQKVAEEVATLEQDYERVWIVAHSLGGAVTVAHLLDECSQVDGIVLIAPAIAVSNQRSPVLPTRFWHEFSKYALPFSSVTCSPFAMDAKDPTERGREHRMIFSPRSIVDRTFELIDHNQGRGPEIETPALVFLAAEDQVVDSNAIEEFFTTLGSTSKRLVELRNSGHMIPVDFEWPKVVDEIHVFIQEANATQPNA